MLGLRSAQGRAILAGVVLVMLLAGVATLANWLRADIPLRRNCREGTPAPQADETTQLCSHAEDPAGVPQ